VASEGRRLIGREMVPFGDGRGGLVDGLQMEGGSAEQAGRVLWEGCSSGRAREGFLLIELDWEKIAWVKRGVQGIC